MVGCNMLPHQTGFFFSGTRLLLSWENPSLPPNRIKTMSCKEKENKLHTRRRLPMFVNVQCAACTLSHNGN